ncbi:DNA-packaging protein [Phreatobacter sp.]|uniref:DNA-packaging protein n=1 Tax=Phreatobacter sp. TaxID=1966341 RepID=UPI003F7151CB
MPKRTMPSPSQRLWTPKPGLKALRRSLPRARPEALAALPEAEIIRLKAFWPAFARREQMPPPGAWRVWAFIGGRGAGKTRAGSEWVHGIVHGRDGFAPAAGRIALIGETIDQVREVMVEGVSGLLATGFPAERPRYEPSRRRLVWPNGAVAHGFSSEDPEALRGPQFDAAWADEAGKWVHAEAVWDMLSFALRLGQRPRVLVTTTPRPTALMRRLLADPATAVTRSATAANAANLAPGVVKDLLARYGGTRLGRQELDGELIADRAGALFSRETFETGRVTAAPALRRIAVAVDPPASHRKGADACGIVAAGIDADGIVFVLADDSAGGLKPHEWAARAAALYRRLDADALVVEVNQGGDMVAAVIGEVAPDVPVTPVRAARSKHLRAEPVAALYAQGRVRHAGRFPALEDEMADFGPDGLSNGASPDRLDALVWAVTHLALRPRAEARVRGL